MTYFTKKPVTIEAFQWTGGPDQKDDPEWIVDAIRSGRVYFKNPETPDVKMVILTLEGDMTASIGDWINKGVKGELYPCKPDIFAETYDLAEAAGHVGLPVKGYQKQSDTAVAIVNQNKLLEERVLRQIETIVMAGLTSELRPPADQRWIAIARTHIEQGFMALNRAVFQPGRVALPEDDVRNFDVG